MKNGILIPYIKIKKTKNEFFNLIYKLQKKKLVMKYLKIFENFKINEEVPYDYDAGQTLRQENEVSDEISTDWSDSELEDLEKIGAENITDSSAIIKGESGFIIEVSKKIGRDHVNRVQKEGIVYCLKMNQELPYKQVLNPIEGGVDIHKMDYSKASSGFGDSRISADADGWKITLQKIDNAFKIHRFNQKGIVPRMTKDGVRPV
jgi:hypothetical protein